ncbi:MAG: serine hydrolase, partial [Opitutaceae bacterium]|nr:serine hydrolase [Verrucomicrobiales bacterium]
MTRYPLLSAFLIFTFALALPNHSAELSFVEGANRHLREMTAGDTPGVAVLVARDGKIVFQGGFGLADVAKKTPITLETKFRIGS